MSDEELSQLADIIAEHSMQAYSYSIAAAEAVLAAGWRAPEPKLERREVECNGVHVGQTFTVLEGATMPPPCSRKGRRVGRYLHEWEQRDT